jgi:hypothetical protein
MIATVLDTARFTMDDPPDVVEAAVCCSTCLARAEEIVIEGDDLDARAVSVCRACGTRTEVALAPDQLCRLAVAPPPALRVTTAAG